MNTDNAEIFNTQVDGKFKQKKTKNKEIYTKEDVEKELSFEEMVRLEVDRINREEKESKAKQEAKRKIEDKVKEVKKLKVNKEEHKIEKVKELEAKPAVEQRRAKQEESHKAIEAGKLKEKQEKVNELKESEELNRAEQGKNHSKSKVILPMKNVIAGAFALALGITVYIYTNNLTDDKERVEQRVIQKERKAKEAGELKVKQKEERKTEEAAELKAKQEEESKAEEMAELKAKQEEERKAAEVAKLKAKQEEERKAAEVAKLKAKQEEERKAAEVAELKAKQEEERKAEEVAELKAKQEEKQLTNNFSTEVYQSFEKSEVMSDQNESTNDDIIYSSLITSDNISGEVKIGFDLPYLDVRHNAEVVKISRIQDTSSRLTNSFSKTSRPCPPFCMHPFKLSENIETVGELELLEFIDTKVKDGSGVLVDTRMPQWFENGTIPGAINILFTIIAAGIENLSTQKIIKHLGATEKRDKWNFDKARQLIFFCNGSWCGQAPRAIKSLVKYGYPEEKLLWYRGGMQAWQLLGLTTTR